MNFILKLLKSKTFDVNALVLIIIAVVQATGVDIPPEMSIKIVAVAMGVVNIILRLMTKDAIADK